MGATVSAATEGLPAPLVFGSGGTGAITHLGGEIFKQTAGVNLTHAPYKGSSQSVVDVAGMYSALERVRTMQASGEVDIVVPDGCATA